MRAMEGFGRFWNANTMLIGVLGALLGLGAAFLGQGVIAAICGLISGTAFMWIGRPIHEDTVDDEA
jgi:hypothetical protein